MVTQACQKVDSSDDYVMLYLESMSANDESDDALAEDYSYALMYLSDGKSMGKHFPVNTAPTKLLSKSPSHASFPCKVFLITSLYSHIHGDLVMRLPTELILEVMAFLGTSDLANILRVSKTIHLVAERVLYRDPEPTPLQVIPCLKMLVSYPNLSLVTRKLTICDLTRAFDMCNNYLSLLSRALHNMLALKHLTLLLDGPYAKYLHGCPFSLRSLNTTLHWDADFVKWMEEQSELRDAMFGGPFVKGTVLAPDALCKISQISATPLILAAIVPLRAVRGVEISLLQPEFVDVDVVWTTFRILSFSTGPVSSVQMIVDASNPTKVLSALNTIPQNISKLDSFVLYGGQGLFTVVGHFPLMILLRNLYIFQDFIQNLSAFVSGFEHLRSITLMSPARDSAFLDQTTLTSLIGTLHLSCPTLECMSFFGSVWTFDSPNGWVALADLLQ